MTDSQEEYDKMISLFKKTKKIKEKYDKYYKNFDFCFKKFQMKNGNIKKDENKEKHENKEKDENKKDEK